jgi:hypothetical protein
MAQGRQRHYAEAPTLIKTITTAPPKGVKVAGKPTVESPVTLTAR